MKAYLINPIRITNAEELPQEWVKYAPDNRPQREQRVDIPW